MAYRYQLADGTVVTIDVWGTRITLPTGEAVRGEPMDTPEYRDTARELGYGDGEAADRYAMCCDHDPLHALLCDWLGLPSHALRYAAGLAHDPRLAGLEEAAVLAVQKLTRAAGRAVPEIARECANSRPGLPPA
jgi:hypothetical protein